MGSGAGSQWRCRWRKCMSRSMIYVSVVAFMIFTPTISTVSTQIEKPTGSVPLRRAIDAFKREESQNERVVGGHPTTIAKNPWQVALLAAAVPLNSKAQFCGGVIVA